MQTLSDSLLWWPAVSVSIRVVCLRSRMPGLCAVVRLSLIGSCLFQWQTVFCGSRLNSFCDKSVPGGGLIWVQKRPRILVINIIFIDVGTHTIRRLLCPKNPLRVPTTIKSRRQLNAVRYFRWPQIYPTKPDVTLTFQLLKLKKQR